MWLLSHALDTHHTSYVLNNILKKIYFLIYLIFFLNIFHWCMWKILSSHNFFWFFFSRIFSIVVCRKYTCIYKSVMLNCIFLYKICMKNKSLLCFHATHHIFWHDGNWLLPTEYQCPGDIRSQVINRYGSGHKGAAVLLHGLLQGFAIIW